MTTDYTPNVNLYKWKTTDTKQTTITETASNAEKIDAKLNDHTAQLVENTKHRTEWINVKQPPYNAPTNGTNNDSIAIQQALNDVIDGGTVYIPKTSIPYSLQTPITLTGKNINIIVEGELIDNVTSFTEDYSTTAITNKGLFAFSGGKIKLTGNGEVLNGNNSTAIKHFLYFYNCDEVFIDNVGGLGFPKSAIMAILCNDVTIRNSRYINGSWTIAISRSNNVTIDNVTVKNSNYAGIVVNKNAEFADNILPFQKPNNVKITNCSAIGIYTPNNYGVGITADSCDNVVVSNNFVDGQNLSTMGYSLADTFGLQIFGNRVINISTTANGTEPYVGLGFEFDRCKNVQSYANTLENVLIGHVIAACENSSFHAISKSTLTGESGAGQSSLYCLTNTVTQSKNITLSGIVEGTDRPVTGQMYVDGLTIVNLLIKNPTLYPIHIYGGNLTNVTMENISILFDGVAPGGIDLYGIADLTLTNFKIKSGAPSAVRAFTFNGTKLFMRQGYIENFNTGIKADDTMHTQVVLNDIDFNNVTTPELVAATSLTKLNLRKDGVAIVA